MQEQVTFKLSQEFLLHQSNDIDSLTDELLLNLKAIEALLVSYHFKSRGRVFDISLDEGSVTFLNPLMGKFIVKYAIGQFNACADVDFTERASMEILIDIDKEKSLGIITGEYIPEREPDEF